MKLTFLQAKKPLAKEITKDGTKPYPLVKNFSSTEEDISIDKKGLDKMFRALCTAAEQGACMHKGPLKRVLKDEPRAFMSDRTAPTELLVLDIDNLSLPQMTSFSTTTSVMLLLGLTNVN